MRNKDYVVYIIIASLIIIAIIKIIQSIITPNTEKINKNTNEKQINIVNNEIIEQTTKEPVQIISHKKTSYSIEVIIKNNTNKELEYVKIKAQCYDKDGNNLGIKSNAQYKINTIDNYKIEIFCGTDVQKYTLNVEYK